MNLAIIPARGGSKRIPRKNIKPFNGIPIIGYSIKAALDSKLFDRVMVSTDDLEIKSVAESLGAEVPFLRSEKTSDDYTGIMDVLSEVMAEYKRAGQSFEYVCCLLATAPLIKVENVVAGHKMILESELDGVLPVAPFSYPLQRALKIESDLLSMVSPEFVNTRSNDLPQRYHDSGQFFWVKSDYIFEKRPLFFGRCKPLIINPMDVQDIDTEEDWKLAEFKMKCRTR